MRPVACALTGHSALAVILNAHARAEALLPEARGVHVAHHALPVRAVGGEQGEHARIIGAAAPEQFANRVGQMVIADADSVRMPADALEGFGNAPRAYSA